MKKNEYKVVYTETVDAVRFFMKTKKKEVKKSITCHSACEAKNVYSELFNTKDIGQIYVLKNDKNINFIELIADVKLEKDMMNTVKKGDEKFTYYHIDSNKDERLFSLQVDENSNAKLVNIDIEKVMCLLDTSTDFNIAFKLLDEAMQGFKYFTVEDIGVILDGCFAMCYENNIVKVVI